MLALQAPAANDQPGGLTAALPTTAPLSNSLSLAFFLLAGQLYAVDPSSGQLAWEHTPYNNSQPIVTGWSDASSNIIYLTSTFLATNRVLPVQINVVEALDAATGNLLWRNDTNIPATSGLPQSNTATTFGMAPAPGLALYAQAARVYAIASANGTQAWGFTVGGSGYGATSANANVTSVTYIEHWAQNVSSGAITTSSITTSAPTPGAAANAGPDLVLPPMLLLLLLLLLPGEEIPWVHITAHPPHPTTSGCVLAGAVLLTNTVFQTVRFLRYNLNASVATAPTLGWAMTSTADFEGALNDDLVAQGLQQPVVSGGLPVTWQQSPCLALHAPPAELGRPTTSKALPATSLLASLPHHHATPRHPDPLLLAPSLPLAHPPAHPPGCPPPVQPPTASHPPPLPYQPPHPPSLLPACLTALVQPPMASSSSGPTAPCTTRPPGHPSTSSPWWPAT